MVTAVAGQLAVTECGISWPVTDLLYGCAVVVMHSRSCFVGTILAVYRGGELLKSSSWWSCDL